MRLRKSSNRSSAFPVVLLAASLLGCAAGPLPELEIDTGPGAEISADGLHRAKNSGYGQLWLKLDADFASYREIVLDPVSISYKRPPRRVRTDPGGRGNFALSDHQMSNLERFFREEFEKELSNSEFYQLVDTPGPRVLRVAAEIIDLVVHVPTRPQPGRVDVFTTSTGEMTLLMELRDSLSGEILARVADRREARAAGHGGVNDLYYSNSVTDTDAVRRVFRRWASILRARLDRVHELRGRDADGGEGDP